MPILSLWDQLVLSVNTEYNQTFYVQQGPSGARGPRGEKVNATRAFLIFTHRHVGRRPLLST